MSGGGGSHGIEAVRTHRRTAVDAFLKVWPTISADATRGVAGGGRYAQCDDFGKTSGYFINAIVVSKDAAAPGPRLARINEALSAQGWQPVKVLDSQELLRATKEGMLVVVSTAGDRYLVSLKSPCARVSNEESTTLESDTNLGMPDSRIPGVPDVPIP